MEDKFQEIIYPTFITINKYIFEKARTDNLSFIDHFMFQATSYYISILHDNFIIKDNSFCKCFIYRSLIEVTTIMNMYHKEDINEDAEELIKYYNFIVEYNIYRKYKNVLEGKQFNFEQIENNYKEARNVYRKKMAGISHKEFTRLLESDLPFLGGNYCFDTLIRRYCPDLYQYYRIMSVMIHPNDLRLTISLPQEMNFKALEAKLVIPIIDVIEKCYAKEELPNCKFLKEKIDRISKNPIDNTYINHASAQKQALFDLANIIEKKFGRNTQSELFRELGRSIVSISLDKTLGFSAIVKAKFKMVIEMISLNYYIAKLPHTVESRHLDKLLTKHTRIKLNEIWNINSDETLKEAYECYLKVDANISFEGFKEKFSKSLGFIPETISISKLVYNFIDDITKNDEVMKEHRKMLYDEAQNLSHANGYMISANYGAFMEYSTVITFVDESINYLIDAYCKIFMIYNVVEKNNSESEFVENIKKCHDRYLKSTVEKNKLDYIFKDKMVVSD